MDLADALTWIADNANSLGPSAILMAVIALMVWGFGTERIVPGRTYRKTCEALELEWQGHNAARGGLAEVKTDVAVANERVADLQRRLARCEGRQEQWIVPAQVAPRRRRARVKP